MFDCMVGTFYGGVGNPIWLTTEGNEALSGHHLAERRCLHRLFRPVLVLIRLDGVLRFRLNVSLRICRLIYNC